MTLAPALTAVCDMLSTRTGEQVILGCPDDGVPGIYVWPWRLEENAPSRKVSPRTHPDGIRTLQAATMSVSFLMLVRPALTPDGLSKLDAARQAILDNPILDVAGNNAKIVFSPLTHRDLAALFTAASLPLTICLSAALSHVG